MIRRVFLGLSLFWLISNVPSVAQDPPPPAPAPAPAASPAAPAASPKELPPLNLPPIPDVNDDDDDMGPDPMDSDKEVPPPPPLPSPMAIPTGSPVVKADLPINQPRLFALDYDGRLVGFSTYDVTGRIALGGEGFYTVKSRARLKLGVGAADDSTFSTNLVLNSKTLQPSYFSCEQKSKGGMFNVTCVYSSTLVAQKNAAGKQVQDHFHTYPDGNVPYLLFNNLWGHLDTFPEHYWLLVRSAAKGGVIQAYDPILRGGGALIVYAPIQEKWKFEGRDVNTLLYPISDMEGTMMARVRVAASNMELLEVEEVGRGLVMRRTSNPAVIAQVDKAKPMDLAPRRIVNSNVLFNDPEKLSSIEADIELSLRGGQFADHRVPGYRQYFTGELKEGYMKGRVTVRSVPREAAYITKYPFRKDDKPAAEIANYLKPGPGVESDFPPILNKALELTWKSESTFVAARRLMNYVSQIEEGVSLPSARYAIESGVGNPESKALVLVALARAAGLPARRVGGLLFRDGTFVPHHWVEIWLGPSEGWAPFDPTTAEAGRVGATHIALWESGDVQKLAVRVVDYSPRAPRKVSFFNRELAWPVGEERTYSIVKDGKKVGTEVAAVREIMVSGNAEVYRFEANANFDGEKPVNVSSELLVDPKGLPVNFAFKDKKGSETFVFEKDTLRLETPGVNGGEAKVREVPFSYGTYLTDQRFLSQWALVVGQSHDANPEKAPKVGEKLTFHVFVPEDLKTREMVLEVKEPETVTLADGGEEQLQKLETEGGMTFLLNKKNQVVKISIPNQSLDLILTDTKTKLLN